MYFLWTAQVLGNFQDHGYIVQLCLNVTEYILFQWTEMKSVASFNKHTN